MLGRQVEVFKEPSELVPHVRFGSLAALQVNISLMAAFGRKADVSSREKLARSGLLLPGNAGINSSLLQT